ncbi:MAG: type I-B CRISPR-associated protein Cas5 [Clostridium sp.]|uniref:CRISPR-associated protein (Cas_Cas5) n=1 Tax=Clostridium paraputrificum TaxID=29363 RepID=A0A6N3AWM0_9CLOT|nr:type I-B CRISPR-associated protein Cas5b [Clostridium sp.]MBS5928362.1 type I-B CRISPR-associated protein Cas5 [Clostridium sp.]
MKALKICLYQETVCYKKPYAFKVTETFPLPPYSTVIGFLHNILGATEYNEMQVSVQGAYDGIFTSYNTTRFYHKEDIKSMPLNVHMLYGVNLTLHVVSTEETLYKIYEGFKKTSKAFTLGRGEDLARIDKIKFVNLNEIDTEDEDDERVLDNCFYVPTIYKTDLKGVLYKVNKNYKIINDLRRWNKINVNYVEKGESLTEGRYYLDNDEIESVVFLA